MAARLTLLLNSLLLAQGFPLLEASLPLSPPSPPPALPIINTSSGLITGFSLSPYTNVTAYLGIPYAAPPLDCLRFAPPQPFVPNDTTTPRPPVPSPKACMQLTFDTLLNDKLTPTAESEDCLTLNIWLPTTHDASSSSLLPVLIWLYGGGFAQGSSTPTDGVPFLLSTPSPTDSLIVVSLNYRLNIFGFPFPTASNGNNNNATTSDPPRNLGLRDQRAAIEWLHDNIAQFGGDPVRMTLMGQSAGSQSIAHYAFAHATDPLVAGLIMWSGQPEGGLLDTGKGWAQTVQRLGCDNNSSTDGGVAQVTTSLDHGVGNNNTANNTANANANANAVLDCMRRPDLSAPAIKHALHPSNFLPYSAYTSGWSAGSPSPDNLTNFDARAGAYLSRGLAGAFARLPTWIQHVSHDGDNLVDFDTGVVPGINATEADIVTRQAMHCPAWLHAGFRVKAGVPVWRGVYNGSFGGVRPYDWMRPFHGADILLAFGVGAEEKKGKGETTVAWGDVGPEARKAAAWLREAVVAFVKDPAKGLEVGMGWKPYEGRGETLEVLFGEEVAGVQAINATEFDAPCREIWGDVFGAKEGA
ncbi:uncharacterized protein HMPREF1541_07781 [Cyphellophora europaea CBS 101466]|uniref:Carboxylic ester hydrolase n=1 Tax=Cyphellophora europaea (strain CBS 101466) TaxID=1220924 RepID=W2RNV4_CYPE1|nr:uncharacterized protein HMPREF1541_07781 [Cyphellophora europaea CBS 101466]ETN38157.1 hypothetical protein HMPREF1541_07781 [Cyphellophora europaea CBS 101466]